MFPDQLCNTLAHTSFLPKAYCYWLNDPSLIICQLYIPGSACMNFGITRSRRLSRTPSRVARCIIVILTICMLAETLSERAATKRKELLQDLQRSSPQ